MGTIVEALSLPTWREYYRDHHVGIQERRRRREVNFFLNWFSARISRCPPSEADLSEKVSLWPGGDLTLLACDAIVNAANTGLWAGGGICGAIFNAAGSSQLKQACKAIDHCNTGESCITSGFNLPATFIIHAVGPVSNNNLALARTYISALNLAKRHRIRTIGFCCISTGIYGFPRHCAAMIALLTVRLWLTNPSNYNQIDRIVFSTYMKDDTSLYELLMPLAFACQLGKEENNSSSFESPNINES